MLGLRSNVIYLPPKTELSYAVRRLVKVVGANRFVEDVCFRRWRSEDETTRNLCVVKDVIDITDGYHHFDGPHLSLNTTKVYDFYLHRMYQMQANVRGVERGLVPGKIYLILEYRHRNE